MSKKSGNKSDQLAIELGSSPSLVTAFSLLHVGALVLLVPIEAPLLLRLLLAGLLLASLYRTLTQHALRSATNAISALRWDEQEGWSLRFGRSGALHAATLHSRFVHRWLVLLSVKPAARSWPVALAIAADALDADSFRRLRAALLAPPRTPAE